MRKPPTSQQYKTKGEEIATKIQYPQREKEYSTILHQKIDLKVQEDGRGKAGEAEERFGGGGGGEEKRTSGRRNMLNSRQFNEKYD